MLSRNKERLLARLKSARGRRKEGLFVVEGIRGGEEALEAGAEVAFALASSRLEFTPRGAALAERLAGEVPDMLWVDETTLELAAHTETPQGVLLVCREPSWTLDSVLDPGREVRRILVLDGIQDPGNAGTLIRVAGAFGIQGVVASAGTVDPWNSKAVRAAAGAIFRVPVVASPAEDVVQAARSAPLDLWIADAGGEDVARAAPGEPWILVIGSEAHGPSAVFREAARGALAIPMPGGMESLNAAVAGGILLYAMTTGRHEP